MPLLRDRRPGTLLPVRVAALPDPTPAPVAHSWAAWLAANGAEDTFTTFTGPWVLDTQGNTVTQDPHVYGPGGARALILRQAPPADMMAALALNGDLTCTAEHPRPGPEQDSGARCVVLVDRRGRHPSEHTNGVTQWENTDPYVDDAPASKPTQPRPPRRVGILLIPESDLENLAQLRPGQRITGIRTDPMMQAVLLRVEGEGLPEVHQATYPPFVDALRYRPPPLVERIDVEGLPAAQQHATVLQVLDELLEHAGHLSVGDTQPALALNAHATWIGSTSIARRHAPDLEDRGAYQPSTGTTPRCQSCTSVTNNNGADVPGAAFWPCPDYRAATQGAVTGLVTPDDK